jgi:hypothetical protein
MIDKLNELMTIIPCREATKLISLSMDRKLTWGESLKLKLHLSVCEACQLFLKQTRGLRRLLKDYRPQGEKQLPADVKERIKKDLHSQ